MPTLAGSLDLRKLALLRSAYVASEMASANVRGIGELAPDLERWNAEIARTFYGSGGPLAPVNRERCLVTLLAHTGPLLPFGVHVYWGLMEGLTVEELCQIVGLVGCYGGLPKCVQGLLALDKVLGLLDRMTGDVAPRAQEVLRGLVTELGGH